MRERNARLVGENKLPPADLNCCEYELETLQAGEELLRRAHAVSHGILERIQKVMGTSAPGREEKILLAETFKRVWKVMEAGKPPATA